MEGGYAVEALGVNTVNVLAGIRTAQLKGRHAGMQSLKSVVAGRGVPAVLLVIVGLILPNLAFVALLHRWGSACRRARCRSSSICWRRPARRFLPAASW